MMLLSRTNVKQVSVASSIYAKGYLLLSKESSSCPLFLQLFTKLYYIHVQQVNTETRKLQEKHLLSWLFCLFG